MDNDLRITAAHEAGHAICGQSLGYVIARVSIEPEIDRIGFCGAAPHLSDLASAIWYMSGPYADAKFRQLLGMKVDWRGSEKDFDDCHRVLNRLVPDLPRATLFDAPLFRTAWDDTVRLVDSLWPEIERFAGVLLKCKTLVGSQLQDALAGRRVKPTAERREELNAIAADLKRTRRPVSPMRDNVSAMFGVPIGHCFKDDVMRRYGVTIMSLEEREKILAEFDRIMGPSVAKRTVPKPAAKRNLAGVRAKAKRAMNELNERHAAR